MKARRTIRIATLLFALALGGASAFAAANTQNGERGEYVGWCDSMCHGAAAPVLEAPYPAYQPLQVCDADGGSCIFY